MTTAPTIKVAFVEDDPAMRKAMARLFRASGMTLITYESAEAYLMDPDRSQVGCLLLDQQLGGMSGLELKQRLALEGSRIPAIVITAQDEPELREQALQAGCAAFLRKSEPASIVLGAVRRAMGSSHDDHPGRAENA